MSEHRAPAFAYQRRVPNEPRANHFLRVQEIMWQCERWFKDQGFIARDAEIVWPDPRDAFNRRDDLHDDLAAIGAEVDTSELPKHLGGPAIPEAVDPQLELFDSNEAAAE